MGMFDFIGSLKNKAKDATMEKMLEKMRDLKMPVSQKNINKLIASHVESLDNVKSAKVDVSNEGLTIKVSFRDGTPSIKRKLNFVELIWTSHKRAFVFEPTENFDISKEFATYACVVTALAAAMQQMLGFDKKKLEEQNFSTEIGNVVSGVLAKDNKLFFDLKRIPLLRQYVHFRVMGQAPLDHLNVTDCWCENGKIVVRVDNNRLVDQIKSMNMSMSDLQKMMKGQLDDSANE